jgi:hypothetical protein
VPVDSPDRVARVLRDAALVLAIVGVLGVSTALVVAALRYERPKITETTLVESLEDETGSAALLPGTCAQLGPRLWSCSIEDDSGSGGAHYAVTATSEHCWRARITLDASESSMPKTASACLH